MALTGKQITAEVEKFLGYPYVYGTEGPSSFDCSGLVQYTLTQLGVKNVPRTSEEQWAWVKKIDKSQLQPGDLVFAQFPGDNESPGHVGIYTGNGQVLSAEDPAQGVGYSTLASWAPNIVGYGQVPGASETAAGTGSTKASSSGATALSYYALGVNSVLSQAGGLVHDVAVMLDYVFGMFGRGQGWRLLFTVIMVAALLGAFAAARTSMGGRANG